MFVLVKKWWIWRIRFCSVYVLVNYLYVGEVRGRGVVIVGGKLGGVIFKVDVFFVGVWMVYCNGVIDSCSIGILAG